MKNTEKSPNTKCNFCSTQNIEIVYTPKHSKIDLKIGICKNCGLVQGVINSQKFESNSPLNSMQLNKLSCDSDYSEIRVGKQQMVPTALRCFDKMKLNTKVKSVLDLRSARGHFALAALTYFDLKEIDCIETDDYMTESYKNNSKINLKLGKYYSVPLKNIYDLIYSSHSLEHYQDPKKVLTFARQKLSPEGYFFVEVPNLETINTPFIVDDFFYDKHLYYFQADLLKEFMAWLGMELCYEDVTQTNIAQLYKVKSAPSSEPFIPSPNHNYEKNKELINKYITQLELSRAKLPNMVSKIEETMANQNIKAVVGCGRYYDALLNYGNLKQTYFDIQIDNYLSMATPELYGRKVYSLDELSSKPVDGVLVITRENNLGLMEKIKKTLFPKVLLHISDVIGAK